MKRVLVVMMIAACGGAPKPKTTMPPVPVTPAVKAAPAPVDGVACVGDIDAPPDGVKEVDDAPLLAQAMDATGKGKLCTGRVYEVVKPVTVYRLWMKAKPYTEYGGWWGLTPPIAGTDAYREMYAICPEWSDLDSMATCTIKVGAHIVIGPGQSADCAGGKSYAKNAANQVFIPNDTRKQQVYVEGCTTSAR